MSGHSLRRRLQQLESRPLPPAQCQGAFQRHRETGELREHPQLRDLIDRAAAFSRAVRERRRVEEPLTGP